MKITAIARTLAPALMPSERPNRFCPGWLFPLLLTSTVTTTLASTLIVTAPPPALAKSATAAIQSLQQSNQRWIEIKLSRQRLIAWEGNTPVYAVIISTGKASTPTPRGVFEIQSRLRTARMQGDDYDITDVPYTLYYSGNYAIHGAYWHNRFGTPVSHGCVNVAVDHARWIYNWASIGTPIVIRD
jgi:lipoprotein-anchoring transpeptidase ErfK/SrfK